MGTFFEEMLAHEKKLEKINSSQEGKNSKCKYCKKSVVFRAIKIFKDPFGKEDKIKWQCQTLNGDNHSSLCLGSENYVPKFAKGDVILSKWKDHTTMYIIGKVDENEGYYDLIYQKKRHNRNRIPIKTIDNKSNRCDEGMVEAIFGQ